MYQYLDNFGYPRWSSFRVPQQQIWLPNEMDNPFYFRGNRKYSPIQENNRQLKCFRCGKLGHFIRQCKYKSARKIQRDQERMQRFIQQKSCEMFPFHELNDNEFLNTVSDAHSGFRLEMKFLNSEIEHYYNAWYEHTKISTKLRNDARQLSAENDKLNQEVQKLESEISDIAEEKNNIENSLKTTLCEYKNVCEKLENEKRKVEELNESEKQTNRKMREIQDENSNLLSLQMRSDYRIQDLIDKVEEQKLVINSLQNTNARKLNGHEKHKSTFDKFSEHHFRQSDKTNNYQDPPERFFGNNNSQEHSDNPQRQYHQRGHKNQRNTRRPFRRGHFQ